MGHDHDHHSHGDPHGHLHDAAHGHSHGHSHSHSKPQHGSRRAFLSSLISAAVLAPWATQVFGQEQNQTPADTAERFRKMSEDFEREGLAEPFKGITTNGTIVPGLFEISPTGVSTEPVRNAAAKFISIADERAARALPLPSRRHRVAQMDEPALLRAPGNQRSGNDAGAARRRVRPDARFAQHARL